MITEKLIRRRREQLANEMAQLQADVAAWNRLHPEEEPIVISADITPDIEAMNSEETKT